MVSAVVVVAGAAIALPVLALAFATHSVPSNWWGGGGRASGGNVTLFDPHSFLTVGGTFIVGGALGVLLVRGWWSMLALDIVGLVIWFVLMPVSHFGAAAVVGWFFWVFGVSAGVGVLHLVHRRQVLRASFVSPPTA
jgi:hypothetical protein